MNEVTGAAGHLVSESSERARAAVLIGQKLPGLIRDELLSEIFAATVAKNPGATAMVCAGVTRSYADVDAEAAAIARGLVARGVKPGDVVGLWMPRGAELLIAQIAITKTGAAWLPFDADAPVDRIAVCLGDAEAKGLLTNAAGKDKAGAELTPWTPEDLASQDESLVIDARAAGATSQSAAYMIYTSGSTGMPKGIVISQANICHYLRSANVLFDMKAEDVVFQGASVAFDLSMEEIWIPYLVGATLHVATPDVMAEADKLPEVLTNAGITVIDTVPTLLAMMTRDIPSLRLIILGGEACPPALIARWAKEGRRLYNSYGPTEATVVATMTEMKAGQPVTIGKPIPNYTCYVADEQLNLLPPGVQGELLIGGPGVAVGYLKRPELTAEKFIANPFGGDGGDPTLYRSGDAVSIDETGNIAFHGRIDDQVKIRGFRVELGEIEAKLTDEPHIAQAAVVVRNDHGIDQLVAFLVPETGAKLDTAALRGSLRNRLPAYMVPGRFEIAETLPRLSSGKIDRKTLKAKELAVIDTAGQQEDPRTETEVTLLAAAKRVFPGQAVPFDADFFTDMGGHSLIAAQFISAVRETPTLATVTLQEIYQLRTLRAIGNVLDQRHALSGGAAPMDLSFTPPPFLRRFICGFFQLLALPFILALSTAQWLGVFISYMLLSGENATILSEMAYLLPLYVLINFGTIAISFAGKWLILGRTKPGRYPLWGVYYYRIWLVQRLMGLTHLKWFQASPLMRVYMRMLGAKVGRDAIISDIEFGTADLITIGQGASIGSKVKFANVEVVGNEMIVGEVFIGPDAYIGSSCVLEHGTRVEEGGEIGDLTSLASGAVVGRYEKWDGSPAVKIGDVDPASLPEPSEAPYRLRMVHNVLYVLALVVIPPLGLLPIFPAFRLFDRLEISLESDFSNAASYVFGIFAIAWPASFALVIFTIVMIAAIRWILLPTRVKPGSYSVHSWFYVRKWMLSLTIEVTLETLSSLFATLYMRSWYRLMGAKIGKGAEISTNLSGRYDLVEIGEKNFIADEVVLGDEDIRRGWMTLEPIKTGARVFIGNDAVVAPGTTIEEGSLIGVKSKPPATLHVGPNETWFGSPPIKLPTRQKVDLGQNWTYEPPFRMTVLRAIFEAFHISLPTALFITLGTISIEQFIGDPLIAGDWWSATFWFFATSIFISLFMAAVVIGVKWAVIGRYKPQMRPMWSFWAMKTEMVAVMYWGLSGRVLNEHLRGTPFLPMLLRLYGAKVGKGVYMDMTDLTEFDCVTIGDFASLNSLCCLQTHLYEDRVMKIGRIDVGKGVVVGAGSTVLYDSKVGDFARLGPLTLVMKGEHIPGNTSWGGAPAAPVRVHGQGATETPFTTGAVKPKIAA